MSIFAIGTPPRKAYIAGPMRGQKHFNFDLFDEVADHLKAFGHCPISPAAIDRTLEGWETYPPEGTAFTPAQTLRFMRRDLIVLLDLDYQRDMIVMLPGWSLSAGARAEMSVAIFMRLPIYLYNAGEFVAYIPNEKAVA